MQITHKEEITQLLEKVKKQFGFPIVHAKDCENVAYVISQKTGEQVSGSTIKRLFGFIKTTSTPNKYTLNLLAKYVGFENFQEFQGNEIEHEWADNTQEFCTTIRIRNGFDSRDWMVNDKGTKQLQQFLKSNKYATALISESGGGKSVLLAQFLSSLQSNERKIIVDAYSLFKSNQEGVGAYLKLLSRHYDLILIDGIEETAYNGREMNHFVGEILDFVRNKTSVKLIISIRPFTWTKFIERCNEVDFALWDNVNFHAFNMIEACNLPLLPIVEKHRELNGTFLPFIHEMNNENSLRYLNQWQLMSEYFNQKVWKTAYAFEKKQFFDHILQETDFGREGTLIKRTSIEPLIVKYKKAHLDLLTLHILKEEKYLNKFGSYTSLYGFGHETYFNYFILSHLLETYNGFTNELLEHIFNEYEQERRLQLLILASSYALFHQSKKVVALFDLELTEYERQTLMIHLGLEIRESTELQDLVLPEFVKSKNGRKYFIERWIDEEYLSGFYGEMLQTYLEHVDSPQDMLFANALLYYNAFLQEQPILCESYFNEVNQISVHPNEIHPFVLGRKYMTKLLEEFRKMNTYSSQTLEEVTLLLKSELKENEDDLPVHFAGFEHNILHAEFLNNHYHFTPQILEKLSNLTPQQLHKKDVDIILLSIFEESYQRSIGHLPIQLQFDLTKVHPWYKPTIENYLSRLNN